MTTGNTVASTVNVAGMAPPEFNESECDKLDLMNNDARGSVLDELTSTRKRKLSQMEEKTMCQAFGTGMTMASATSQVPGSAGTMSASSSGCAQATHPSGLVSGGTGPQKVGLSAEIRASDAPEHHAAKELAGVLCDKSHVHPGGGAGGHAEAKIMSHLSGLPGTAMQGGNLLLNIDWRFDNKSKKSSPKQSGMPCILCFKMLCHAQKECDINIFICDKDNSAQPLSDGDCEDDDAYADLCVRVDGRTRPGR